MEWVETSISAWKKGKKIKNVIRKNDFHLRDWIYPILWVHFKNNYKNFNLISNDKNGKNRHPLRNSFNRKSSKRALVLFAMLLHAFACICELNLQLSDLRTYFEFQSFKKMPTEYWINNKMTLYFVVVDEKNSSKKYASLDLPNLYKINWTLVLIANPICWNLSTKSPKSMKITQKIRFYFIIDDFFV